MEMEKETIEVYINKLKKGIKNGSFANVGV